MSNFEFDGAYSAITGHSADVLYLPTLEHDDMHDVTIDGAPYRDVSEWHLITGKTGQYGCGGPVMHASETASDDVIREWVRDAGGDIFALVEVAAPCTEDEPCLPDEPTHCQEHGCDHEPAGWAVLYRNAGE